MIKPTALRRILLAAQVAVLISFFISCANMVAPSGGPRDEDPPEVVRSNPPNFSTNFKANRVRIYFDEYVELKNIRQKLIISPPIETMPEFRMRGKSIIMQFNEEELMPNTTYNFFFDDAIVDITEGNAMSNFRFVFSTGDYLDSLSVRGNIVDAYTLQPEENVYVMLYDNIYDSVPYLEKPAYIAKADKEGNFEINFLRKNKYKMFALQDINSNYLFDLPNEKIAFLDSLIIPEYIGHPHLIEETAEEDEAPEEMVPETEENEEEEIIEIPDLEKTDSLEIAENDSVIVDSLALVPTFNFYNLYLFEEEDTVQKLASASLIRKNVILFQFRVKADSISLREIREPFDRKWHYSEMGKGRDSLTLWLIDVERDSLFLEISDKGNVIDTAKISLVFRERTARGRRPETDVVKKMDIGNNLAAGRTLPYYQKLRLIADNPIKDFDDNCFELIENDSIPVEISVELGGKSNRHLNINNLLPEDSQYKLIIKDSCITDIYGFSHDTLRIRFRTDSEEAYGKIILNLDLPENNMQYILQLLDNKNVPIREKIINGSGVYSFAEINAGVYFFKLIEDANRDGRWTSGRYLKGIQPERVILLKENIQLRQNWIMEMDWKIKESQKHKEEEPPDDE